MSIKYIPSQPDPASLGYATAYMEWVMKLHDLISRWRKLADLEWKASGNPYDDAVTSAHHQAESYTLDACADRLVTLAGEPAAKWENYTFLPDNDFSI